MTGIDDRFRQSNQIKNIFTDANCRVGCIEVAVTALDGDAKIIAEISSRKVRGELNPRRRDDRIIEESGLEVKRAFNIDNGGQDILTSVERALKEPDVTGALVISNRKNMGHAVAVVREENETLSVVDVSASKWIETKPLADVLKQKEDDLPYAVLMMRRKKR